MSGAATSLAGPVPNRKPTGTPIIIAATMPSSTNPKVTGSRAASSVSMGVPEIALSPKRRCANEFKCSPQTAKN